jgi:hypothetical protein
MPASKFDAYRDERVVRKAEEMAGWVLPGLMTDPNKTDQKAEALQYDYQSVGALLVNNLTAKLAGALFPAGRPFHKLKIDAELKAMALESGTDESALEAGAAEMERLSTEQLFKNAALSRLHRALKLAIVTGDCLLYRDTRRHRFLVWNLHSYAVRRNAYGQVDEVILKQRVRVSALPTDLQRAYSSRKPGAKPNDVVEMFTEVVYDRTNADNPNAVVQQSIEGILVSEPTQYPEHLCPYIVLSWSVPDGEHYGRGYVEEYCGDFAKLSQLSEYLALYEMESLHMLNLVDEAGGGVVDDYQGADLGEYVPGKAGSITSYERGDYHKIAQVQQSLEQIEQRLARAFMYNATQRNSERTTATEVRIVAEEAENLLGGTYSILAETLQAPLAYLCMYEVALQADDTDVLYEVVQRQYRPEILTGIPALTQASETQNLMRATGELAQIIPALAELSQRFDTEKVIELVMRNNSVPLESISKTPEEMEQEARLQAEQQEAMLQAQEAALQENVIQDGAMGIQGMPE